MLHEAPRLIIIDHAVLTVLYMCYNMQQLLYSFIFVQTDTGFELESFKNIVVLVNFNSFDTF